MGGKMDGRVFCSADGVVHVGQRLLDVQPAVGPVHRSISDTTTTTSTRRRRRRNVRDVTVIEPVCTLQTCSHCCTCHLRHNSNGYGRCMKSASVPWPDCACVGKCPASRCGQPECVSNHIVIDLTDTGSHSQPHNDHHHSTDVSVVSHPSTLSSPLPGVRREAGGVHVDEKVCIGPQADTHSSSAAAYRQLSATVTDSVLVVSQAVSGSGEDETTAHTTGGSGGAVHSPLRAAVGSVTVDRPLPPAVHDQLPSLLHQPRRLAVIADGHCSVASVLLARGVIPDVHITEQGRQTIDAERRQLGRAMVD